MGSKWNDPYHNFYAHTFITNKCWLWTGAVDKDGYGVGTFLKKKVAAHRISYILHEGGIPKGQFVLHTCNNPSCVNPLHLYLGTQKDNIQDQIKSGTNSGINKVTAKLTWKDVFYIRESNKHYRELANELGVSHYCVWDVIQNRSWKNGN